MKLSFDLKKNILSHVFIFVAVFCLSFFIEIKISKAIIYDPGETLNPACAPSDLNCDVRAGVNVPTGAGAGSLVYGTSTDVYNTLSIGSNGQILKIKDGGLSWSSDEAIQSMGKAGGQTLIGGTEANNALIIQSNSASTGNTATNAAIKFKVGNSGATEALTILNNGNVNVNGNITIEGDIIPSVNNTYSLGSPTKVWRDVYIGPGSLYVNGQKVLQTDASDNVAITADTNQSLLMKTFGTGDLEFNPSGSGQILLKGDLRLSADKKFVGAVNFDNLNFTENTISARNLNGGISLTPNGNGGVYITNGNFGISTTSPAEKLDVVGNLRLSGAFMPGGLAGENGQFLISRGSGLAPLWTSYNTANWDTAYSWGNHASSSYLTSFTELDPIWNSEKGTYALKSEIPVLTNLSVSNFATSSISQWTNDSAYTTLASFSVSGPLSYNSTSGVFSLSKADSLVDGYLSALDWNNFNSKISTTTGNWLGTWQDKNASDFAPSSTISSQWTKSNSDISYSDGNVGIGTSTPSQQLEISKSFSLPVTTGTTPYGIIYKGASPFIHDFKYGLNSNNITTVGGNTFIGISSGNFAMGSTATVADEGSYNTGVGLGTLSRNTKGGYNNAIGSYALYYNTTGYQNNAQGNSALYYNTTGGNNTAIGSYALFGNSTGNNNTAIGNSALFNNTTATGGSAFGRQALYSNTTGQYNTGLGLGSLYRNTTGSYSIGIGYNAGSTITGGSTANTISNNSIFIGYNTRAQADNQTNQIVIGSQVTGLGSNTVVIGNSSIITTALRGNVGIGTTSPAYKLDVEGNGRFTIGLTIDSLGTGALYSNAGALTNTDPSDINLKQNILNIDDSLSKIMSLRPVSFEWKNTGELSQGFIAQEVETVIPELVGNNPGGYKGLYTTRFIPYIVKAIQEQQSFVDYLTSSNSEIFTKIQEQKNTLDSLSFNVSNSLNISNLNKLVLSGGLEVSGHVALGEDSVGEAEIIAGDLETRIIFSEDYLEKPIITITPKANLTGSYWVSDVDAQGFTIKLKETQVENISFYWHAFAKKGDFFPVPEPEPVIVTEPETPVVEEEVITPEPEVITEEVVIPEPEVITEEVVIPEPEVITEEVVIPEPEVITEEVIAPEIETVPEILSE